MEGYIRSLTRLVTKNYRGLDSEVVQPIVKKMMVDLVNSKIGAQGTREQLSALLANYQKSPPTSNRGQERLDVILPFFETHRITPRRLLDVGAGSGEITIALKNHFRPQLTLALDYKTVELEGITSIQYRNGLIPLPDNSLDLVVSFVTLHHISPEDRTTLIKEIKRVLVRGGIWIIKEHDDDRTAEFQAYLIIIHSFWYVFNQEEDDQLFLMTQEQLAADMKEHDFQSVEIYRYPEPNYQRLYYDYYINIK